MKERNPWFLKKGESRRKWKSQKRQELRDVIRALDVYRIGCAYCPEYESVEVIDRALKGMKGALSVKAWGR